MPCYMCQGEGGDEYRLCSECNNARREGLKNPFPTADQLPPPPLVTPSRLLTVCGIIAAICLSLLIICYAPFGPGYGLSTGEQAYRRCLEKKKAAAEAEAKTNSKTTGKLEIVSQAKLDKIEAVCDAIRADCEKNPTDPACQAMLVPTFELFGG